MTEASMAAAVAYRDPLEIIGEYEPEPAGSYTSLVGGGQITTDTQFDEYGFPIWDGWKNSHASGKYQFEPATWRLYAARLGITDFSPRSQDAVAAAAFAAHGFNDWAPYNTRLAAAIQAAGGMAAFSLGASWLAAAPPRPLPVPPPTPPQPSESVSISGTATDATGKTGAFVGTITGIALAAAVIMAPSVTTVPPPPEAHKLSGGYGVSWNFAADGSPQCLWSDGSWRVCE